MSVLGRNGKVWDDKGQQGTRIFITMVRFVTKSGAALMIKLANLRNDQVVDFSTPTGF